MNQEQIRQEIEKRRRRTVDDKVWATALADTPDESPTYKDDLYDEVIYIEGILDQCGQRLSGRRNSAPRIVTDWQLSDSERLRSDALELCHLQMASEEPAVRAFRKDVLEGQLLSVDGALTFLRSAACRYVPLEELRRHKVPLAAHESLVLSVGPRRVVVADLEARADSPEVRECQIWVEPPGEVITTTVHMRRKTTKLGDTMSYISLALRPPKSSETEYLPVADGSIVDKVRVLAEGLEDKYMLILERLPLFIVGGERPGLNAVDFPDVETDLIHGTITMRVSPWISPSSVKKVYGNVQRIALGGSPHPMSEKNVRLFAFIAEEGEPKRRSGRWMQLLEKWNREQPAEWRYSDLKQFQRDYRERAKKTLCQRYYKHL